MKGMMCRSILRLEARNEGGRRGGKRGVPEAECLVRVEVDMCAGDEGGGGVDVGGVVCGGYVFFREVVGVSRGSHDGLVMRQPGLIKRGKSLPGPHPSQYLVRGMQDVTESNLTV